MDLVVEGNQEQLRVKVEGDVTAENCGELREAVMQLAPRQAKEIQVDLASTPFIDTSGLGVLVGLRTHLRKHGTVLSLANPQPRVEQVLRMTQLSRLFGIK